MRKYLFITMLCYSSVTFCQSIDCDCSSALIQDTNLTTNWLDAQQFYYKYFSSDKKTRKNLRRSAGLGINLNILDQIDVGLDGSSASNSSLITSLQKVIEEQGYFSQKNYETLYTSILSVNSLSAYRACLESDACAGTNTRIKSQVFGDVDDVFTLQLVFLDNSGIPEAKIENITYNNCIPYGLLVFKSGVAIKDGQSKSQPFKKLRKDRAAFVTVNFENPGIRLDPIEVNGTVITLSEKMPIGAIVASVLDYPQFNIVNGLPTTFNSNTSTWAPCDGRTIANSKYATSGASIAPDLRGLFLRGVNEMYSGNLGSGTLNSDQLNVEDKNSGEFQNDAFQDHTHKVGIGITDKQANSQASPRFADWVYRSPNVYQTQSVFTTDNNVRVSEETRPKNMTVYYYVRIN